MVKQRWVKYDDNWFYINKRGRMAVDKLIIHKGKHYYVNNKGELQGQLGRSKTNKKDEK